MAGGVFALYSDTNANKTLEFAGADLPYGGPQETDLSGSTAFASVPCGDYFVLQTIAPRGYQVSPPQLVHVGDGASDGSATALVSVSNHPLTGGVSPGPATTATPALSASPTATMTPPAPPPTATSAATLAFGPASTVAAASDVADLMDLSSGDDLRGASSDVALAWISESGGSSYKQAWVRTSEDGGTTWAAPFQLSVASSHVSLASGGTSSVHTAVWQDDSNLMLYSATFLPTGSWVHNGVFSDSPTGAMPFYPTVGLTDLHTLYAWVQLDPTSGEAGARLSLQDVNGLQHSMFLGEMAYAAPISIATTANSVVLAWTDAAGKVVTLFGAQGGNATAIIWEAGAPGSPATLATGQNPIVALWGGDGLIAYQRKGDVYVQLTDSGGLLWAAPVKVLDGSPGNPYWLTDAAMYQGNLVITGTHGGNASVGPIGGTGFRLVSVDGGSTWSVEQAHPVGGDNRHVAFVTASGLALAEAWVNSSDTEPYPWPIRYHTAPVDETSPVGFHGIPIALGGCLKV
jgi:hypothetical protein